MAQQTATASHSSSSQPRILDREPLVLNNRSYSWITNRICGIVENRQPKLWWILFIPSVILTAIMAFCCIGVYSVSSNAFDLYAMGIFGFIGYLLIKLDCEPAPLLLGFILGPMLEENLRRAMLLSRGDPIVFVTRPISATLLAVAAILLLLLISPKLRAKREEAFQE